MPSMFNAATRDKFRKRIDKLSPTSERRWGTMSSEKMICHLGDQVRLALGEPGDAAPRHQHEPPAHDGEPDRRVGGAGRATARETGQHPHGQPRPERGQAHGRGSYQQVRAGNHRNASPR